MTASYGSSCIFQSVRSVSYGTTFSTQRMYLSLRSFRMNSRVSAVPVTMSVFSGFEKSIVMRLASSPQSSAARSWQPTVISPGTRFT